MKLVCACLAALVLCLGSGSCSGAQVQSPGRFAAYESCRFNDALELVENTPLTKGIEGRTVKTIMGPKQVPLAGGTRLLYSYPHTEPFVNVKVEHIPSGDYAGAKETLIANFEQILTADDSSMRNYMLKPRMNGLEIYGLDRKKLEGSVLGIYLFFIDHTHTVTTTYFLNQDAALRKFASLEEYATLRDAFLETYTGCAAGKPHSAVTSVSPVVVNTPKTASAADIGFVRSAANLPDAPSPQQTTKAADVQSASAEPVSPAPAPLARSSPVRAKSASSSKKPGTASAHGGPKHTAKKEPAKQTTKRGTAKKVAKGRKASSAKKPQRKKTSWNKACREERRDVAIRSMSTPRPSMLFEVLGHCNALPTAEP